MNKMTKYINNKSFQRIFYLIMFLLVNIISLKNFDSLKANSSIGIPYLYFWIIPSIILLYQVVFNNLLGWLLFYFFYFFYLVWLLYSIISGIIQDYDNFRIESYFMFFVIITFYVAFGYFVYLIKPMKRQ
ncbi:MAG: hypothetical protein BGN96_02605 [Bacteroidales bacterium 45-6]|nr:MAG: hypothetical protein BGN96_02605 [Bacteroidales bacterium 45-6]